MSEGNSKIIPKPIKLIAAACKNMGIGWKGHLPWNLPKEFQYLLDTITRVRQPDFLDYVTTVVDEGGAVDITYLHFSKAFDTVSHKKLIDKLLKIGLNPLIVQWICSWVKGKKNLIVWGRRSFEAFDENLLPLANTIIVLLTRQLSEIPKYAHYMCRDEDEVVQLVSSSPLYDEIEAIWVLGGVECYKNMMRHPWCNHIYFTHIMADFECDTFFPEFDKNVFKLKEAYPGLPSGTQEEKGVKYIFRVYEKDQPPNNELYPH